MLYEFRDKTFLEYKQYWFVWESAWEAFRPIDAVSWDGSTFQIDDTLYCMDPTSSTYGYGSPEMAQLCELLKDKYDESATKVSTLPLGAEWFRDRFVTFTSCAPRDVQSWKRMVRNKPRTCRKAPRGKKLTRRIRG